MFENEHDERPTLWPFYKEFERGRKFGPNGIETGVHNFFSGNSSGNQGLPSVSLGSLAIVNMLLSCGKSDRNGRKRARRKAYPSAIL